MGRSHGTGIPNWFQCSKCRGRKWMLFADQRAGQADRVRLTGRKRPNPSRSRGSRISSEEREFECLDCGHVGWSRHIDLERKERIGAG